LGDLHPFTAAEALTLNSGVVGGLLGGYTRFSREYGIELYVVIEYGTRRVCSICHIKHESAEIHR